MGVGAVGARTAGIRNPWDAPNSALVGCQAAGVGLVGRNAACVTRSCISTDEIPNAGFVTAAITIDADITGTTIAVNRAGGRRRGEFGAGTGVSGTTVGYTGKARLTDHAC